jgi:hypothetical protein
VVAVLLGLEPWSLQRLVGQVLLLITMFSMDNQHIQGEVVLHAGYDASNHEVLDAFAVGYTFKVGYTYKVKVWARSSSSFGSFLGIYIPSNLTGSNNCSGAVQKPSLTTTGMITATSPGSYTQVETANITVSSTQNYIRIESASAVGSSLRSIYIYQISIEVTATPSFPINSTTLSLSCGSTTAQTFTMTNPSNVNDISSVVWTLGASNGWLYGGTAAPSTINTGTSLSLSLTPSCGAALSNISVTVTFGFNYTYTTGVTVTATSPNPYISPNNSVICTSETYTLNNAPCGNTVTWSGMNSNVSNNGVNNNPITITKINNTDFTLTGTVSGCGNTYSVSKDIHVGPVTAVTGIDQTFVEVHCHISFYKFTALGAVGATSFAWSYDDGSGYQSFGTNSRTANFQGDGSCSLITVKVEASNACSSTPQVGTIGSDQCTPYDDPNCSPRLMGELSSKNTLIYPNPTRDRITISIKALKGENLKNTLHEIKSVIIYDDKTGRIMLQKTFSRSMKTVTIDVSQLPADIYTILISDNQNTVSKQLSKL